MDQRRPPLAQVWHRTSRRMHQFLSQRARPYQRGVAVPRSGEWPARWPPTARLFRWSTLYLTGGRNAGIDGDVGNASWKRRIGQRPPASPGPGDKSSWGRAQQAGRSIFVILSIAALSDQHQPAGAAAFLRRSDRPHRSGYLHPVRVLACSSPNGLEYLPLPRKHKQVEPATEIVGHCSAVGRAPTPGAETAFGSSVEGRCGHVNPFPRAPPSWRRRIHHIGPDLLSEV